MAEAASKVEQLEQKIGADWRQLKQARLFAQKTRQNLMGALAGLDSDDTSIVVLGSLARDEFTPGSDVDWTLLIDGAADPRHHDLFREVDQKVNQIAPKRPGAEGTFGSMVFSHEVGPSDRRRRRHQSKHDAPSASVT